MEPWESHWTGWSLCPRFVATMMHLCDSSTLRGRARFPEITQSLTLQRGEWGPSRGLLFFFCFLVFVRSKGGHSWRTFSDYVLLDIPIQVRHNSCDRDDQGCAWGLHSIAYLQWGKPPLEARNLAKSGSYLTWVAESKCLGKGFRYPAETRWV